MRIRRSRSQTTRPRSAFTRAPRANPYAGQEIRRSGSKASQSDGNTNPIASVAARSTTIEIRPRMPAAADDALARSSHFGRPERTASPALPNATTQDHRNSAVRRAIIWGAFGMTGAVAWRYSAGVSLLETANTCTQKLRTRPCGAGGNRTPVRRRVDARDTTIPESAAPGCRTAGSVGPEGPATGSFPRVSGLSRRQRSVPAVSTASVAGLQWTGPACRCRSR